MLCFVVFFSCESIITVQHSFPTVLITLISPSSALLKNSFCHPCWHTMNTDTDTVVGRLLLSAVSHISACLQNPKPQCRFCFFFCLVCFLLFCCHTFIYSQTGKREYFRLSVHFCQEVPRFTHWLKITADTVTDPFNVCYSMYLSIWQEHYPENKTSLPMYWSKPKVVFISGKVVSMKTKYN